MSKGYLQSSRRLLTGPHDMMEATTTPIWGRASTLTFFKMTDLSKIVASTLLPSFFFFMGIESSLFQSKLSPFRSTSMRDRFNKAKGVLMLIILAVFYGFSLRHTSYRWTYLRLQLLSWKHSSKSSKALNYDFIWFLIGLKKSGQ